MSSPLLIIGGNNLALEIREIANFQKDRKIYNVVSDGESCLFSYITDSELEPFIQEYPDSRYIIGFTIKKLRDKFITLFNKYNLQSENVIAPNAHVANTVKMGNGNYIGANVVLSSCVNIGNRNIINFMVGIGHDAEIGNDCTLNPGAKVSGHCIIGDNCLIGANSFVHQGVKVCSNSVIDALTYIRENVEIPMICTDRNKKQLRIENILSDE